MIEKILISLIVIEEDWSSSTKMVSNAKEFKLKESLFMHNTFSGKTFYNIYLNILIVSKSFIIQSYSDVFSSKHSFQTSAI